MRFFRRDIRTEPSSNKLSASRERAVELIAWKASSLAGPLSARIEYRRPPRRQRFVHSYSLRSIRRVSILSSLRFRFHSAPAMSIDPETALLTQLRWSRPERKTGVHLTAPVRHAGGANKLILQWSRSRQIVQSKRLHLTVD